MTPDHVNPEAPWPQLSALEAACRASGKQLIERLAIYPRYVRALDRWVDPACEPRVLRRVDADGWPRTDDWAPGLVAPLPEPKQSRRCRSRRSLRAVCRALLDRADVGPRAERSARSSRCSARAAMRSPP